MTKGTTKVEYQKTKPFNTKKQERTDREVKNPFTKQQIELKRPSRFYSTTKKVNKWTNEKQSYLTVEGTIDRENNNNNKKVVRT